MRRLLTRHSSLTIRIQTTTNLPPTSFALPAHPHDTVQSFVFTYCIFSCSCVMCILLTGSSGVVGSAILVDLLKKGHRVTALDAVALPDGIRQILSPDASCRLSTHIVDLTDFKRLEEIMSRDRPEGVIHLSAIPNPLGRDPRVVHNNNVTSSYNVLCTAAMHGVKRIVQASSVNAVGLSYTPAGNQRFDALPLTEGTPYQTVSLFAQSGSHPPLQCIVPDSKIRMLFQSSE